MSTDVASLAAWLKTALDKVTRKLKHTGNHRYLFGLTSALKRHLPKSLAYPKLNMGQQSIVSMR